MPLIDDATLAELRALSDDALPESCTVSRKGAFTPNGSGGGTWTPASHDVACRFAPLGGSPQERVFAERHDEDDVGRLTTAVGADLRVGDSITFRGATWKVVGSLERGTYGTADDWVVTR